MHRNFIRLRFVKSGELNVIRIIKLTKIMSVYMIIETKIKNSDLYLEYIQKVQDIVTTYGGKYLVRGCRRLAGAKIGEETQAFPLLSAVYGCSSIPPLGGITSRYSSECMQHRHPLLPFCLQYSSYSL